MKKTLIAIALIASFGFGFTLNSVLTKSNKEPMTRVTGIGGIFFKCKNPEKIKQWYATHLGLDTNQYGAIFTWREENDSARKGITIWSPFSENTKYFEPSSKDFMVDYRVKNLDTLVTELKKEGVMVLDKVETYDYGKFVHILDIEGNKVELWEPKGK